MTKYKIVGIANLLFGTVGILIQGNTLLFIYPRMLSLYADFGTQLPLITQAYPYISGVVILIFTFMVYIGLKLAFGKASEKLFKIGTVSLIAILLLAFIFYTLLSSSIIFPLYNLSLSEFPTNYL